jgi:endonuclease/exonuclease/phosphatase family metal-dependent hydrolase
MSNQFDLSEPFDVGLKVGTFNLRNLANAGFQYYPNADPYTAQEYANKRDWIAQQIDRMNADIIVFEEVFHAGALQDVLSTSRTMRQATLVARDAVSMPPKDGLVPQVAIATRLPLMCPAIWVEDYGQDFSITPPGYTQPLNQITRAVPHITVKLPNDVPLHVLGLHLKSKRPDYLETEDESNPNDLALATFRSLMRRSADAIGIRRYLNGLLQKNHEPCIVTGDFNDHSHAVSTQIIAGAGRFGKSFYDFQLFDAMRIQTQNDPQRYVAYSYIHDGVLEVLDHIYVSEEFHPNSRHQIAKVREVYCLNDHLHTRSKETSDHGQTVASFLFKSQHRPA